MSAANQANQRLVDQLIARGALWSEPLMDAFRATPRHFFLDRFFHFHRDSAAYREHHADPPSSADLRLIYSDRAITTRLSVAQQSSPAVPVSSSSQPSLMAQMLEDLQVKRGQRIMEIGAGTGYNAALLGYLAGRVISLDIDRDVLAEASKHLNNFPERTVELVQADGRNGWPQDAPYDRIQVTAATPDLEPAWCEQLVEGGRVQAPIDLAPGLAFTVQVARRGALLVGHLIRPAYFMPLRDDGSGGTLPENPPAGLLPEPASLTSLTAPWADWEERKTACHDNSLQSALAFIAWLKGFTLAYQNDAGDHPSHAVADLVHGNVCWLGTREWSVTGQAGEQLARSIWQTFLDAGGPRPTEFRLTAWHVDLQKKPAAQSNSRLAFIRQGPRTTQLWELPEQRERPNWN